MIQRTVQLIGQIHGRPQLSIVWDNQEVFNGTVKSMPNIGVVCSWFYSTKKFGNIPLEIKLQGFGKLVWADVYMNYTGDYECLPGSQSSGGVRVSPDNFFSSPAFQQPGFDGKSLICINGEPVSSIKSDEDVDNTGAWHYVISSGQCLTCCYKVDRKKLRLYTPTFDY